MSCFVLSNLVVTAGMLTPGLGVSFLTTPLKYLITDKWKDDRNIAMANYESIS